MCTGNFYCNEATIAAVDLIATSLNVQTQVIEQTAHIFQAYEMPWDAVAEQNLYPKNPQKTYRELLSDGSLCIYNGHACVGAERD